MRGPRFCFGASPRYPSLMTDSDTIAKPKAKPKTARPPLWKVLLLNDDFTPRGFVVKVLQKVFRMTEGEAEAVMMAAHLKGVAVVAVFTLEIAETKAQQANDMAAQAGFPLTFTLEKEE